MHVKAILEATNERQSIENTLAAIDHSMDGRSFVAVTESGHPRSHVESCAIADGSRPAAKPRADFLHVNEIVSTRVDGSESDGSVASVAPVDYENDFESIDDDFERKSSSISSAQKSSSIVEEFASAQQSIMTESSNSINVPSCVSLNESIQDSSVDSIPLPILNSYTTSVQRHMKMASNCYRNEEMMLNLREQTLLHHAKIELSWHKKHSRSKNNRLDREMQRAILMRFATEREQILRLKQQNQQSLLEKRKVRVDWTIGDIWRLGSG